jgi:hypothetical protein
VIGGLWPAELSTVTAQTAPLADYLKSDLQRIVNSANEELRTLKRAGMADSARQAAEAHVIKSARAYAIRRVESTVRHLRNVAQQLPAEYQHSDRFEDLAKTGVVKSQRLPAVTMAPTGVESRGAVSEPSREDTDKSRGEPTSFDQDDRAEEPIESVEQSLSEPDIIEPSEVLATYPSDPYATEALEDVSSEEVSTPRRTSAAVDEATTEIPAPRHTEPAGDVPAATRHAKAPDEPESDRERLQRLLEFVARQEPGLRWAVGDREDGMTVLATDVAHGWVPPGIVLPAGVRLLEPRWRTGNAAALLGPTTRTATYAPGDPLGWAAESDTTETSLEPRELPVVDDLGWLLSEATHWRDGLPRIVHTLAKAGAAGTGVVEVEVDVLRVHLEVARYHLMAQYPDVDAALLLNCLLLAATEGIATGDRVAANYHFAWFQMLSAPPPNKWTTGR